MKLAISCLGLCVAAGSLLAQTAPQPPPSGPATTASTAGRPAAPSVIPDLDRLQAAASQISATISHMRIERWKADSNSKQQAQSNADSIQRNLTSALPGMIDSVRSSPQDLAAEFKLYRNTNALYDVMTSLTEAAGAFGTRGEYEALAQQLEVLDSVRRNLGDTIEQLVASTQSEMGQLRTELQAAQRAAAAAAAAPPKKVVIVDDNAPDKKATTKKKPAAKKPPNADENATSNPSAPKN